MDTDLLVAELLLRGFEHHKDDKIGRKIYGKIYGKDEVVVAVRSNYAVVCARFNSVEKLLEMTDYAIEKTNDHTSNTQ